MSINPDTHETLIEKIVDETLHRLSESGSLPSSLIEKLNELASAGHLADSSKIRAVIQETGVGNDEVD